MASATVAAMLAVHRARRTWGNLVDVYVAALTESAREKLIRGGLPAEKIFVKPNFVYPDPGLGQGLGGYALFAGRLAPEKGINTLLAAWERLEEPISLKIVGDGPLAQDVAKAIRNSEHIEWLGKQPAGHVLALMQEAHVLIVPSIWYEGFPRVIAEAFAVGLPVIASDLGAMASLITHGRTGLLFRPGDPNDLATQINWSFRHLEDIRMMRRAARAEYEAKYTPEHNYQMLMDIYEIASARARESSAGTW
jgi:glycosyltransferase involved in cell wall biosynthesis